MKSDLDAVASQTGMSHLFKLRGVDIYRVLECLPFDSQVPAESPRKTDSLPELEAFSERLAACGDLDSLLDTGLAALSNVFGIDHSFVMALDEDGTRPTHLPATATWIREKARKYGSVRGSSALPRNVAWWCVPPAWRVR